jgi:uncharacterized protein YbaR (Trm112 family)
VHSEMRISETLHELLICPICKSKLKLMNDHCGCGNANCNASFPIVNGIPILINEGSSVFSIADFVSQKSTFFRPRGNLKARLGSLIPSVSKNMRAKRNYGTFGKLLLQLAVRPRVLILGGSIIGEGMDSLIANHSIETVETDASWGPRTTLICDAHDIPFEDGSFDGAIAQAVLEHVVDPYRCVDEIHRVLKVHGLVYAETPFMQQVHGGKYDFTRFTHLGHRRLFRQFVEVESGATSGPAAALAWSYHYFLMSFTSSKILRAPISAFARLTSFYLKYLDYFLLDKPGAIDAASGCYFLGRKENHILTDRDLIKLYRGLT